MGCLRSGDSPSRTSAEKLDCRGGPRPQEVRHRILTTDKGSSHLDGSGDIETVPDALGPHEDRVDSAVSTHRKRSDPIAISRAFDGRRRLIATLGGAAAWPLVSNIAKSVFGTHTGLYGECLALMASGENWTPGPLENLSEQKCYPCLRNKP